MKRIINVVIKCQIILILKRDKRVTCMCCLFLETVSGKIFWDFDWSHELIWSYGCFIVTARHVMTQGQDLCLECLLFLIAYGVSI